MRTIITNAVTAQRYRRMGYQYVWEYINGRFTGRCIVYLDAAGDE